MAIDGKRVLLAEDEPIIAMSAEDMLIDLGCIVVGPAFSAAAAAELAHNAQFDAALLDVNLGDGPSFPVASILQKRRIPFSFVTGYGQTGLPPDFLCVPVLAKPYTKDALCGLLRELFSDDQNNKP